MNYSNTKSITKSFTSSIELVPINLTSTSLTNWLLSKLDNLVWLSYCKLWGFYSTNCVTKSIDNFNLIRALKSGSLIKIQAVGVLIGSKSFEFYFNIIERNGEVIGGTEWEFVGDGFMTYVIIESNEDKEKSKNIALVHPSTLSITYKLQKLSIIRKSVKSQKLKLNNQFNWDFIRNSFKNDDLPMDKVLKKK
ncbi:hypothetical protein CONCODRAFT_8889 [Conidiobolus coronatus NRRL 28638]|uniref:HotDog ACOT-type domain-containing protein n=1 Tax=Conidiobolus coronatus (strain ATCC 28846 / CBS 209.66 / NRRL 28638) TaxID=796925 RepID=A0A137P1A4_CONC2|nr:hypothetical protein CONCODRAFT_8889 [Conidiobolus coronatus NRRL 28638]|eukprot:KXN68782.1 hypothetical protein CONCODRAFT_8889 [Conidiobolus coronatus NRRL 28638]